MIIQKTVKQEEAIQFLESKGLIPYQVWVVDMPEFTAKDPHDMSQGFSCCGSDQMTIEQAYFKFNPIKD